MKTAPLATWLCVLGLTTVVGCGQVRETLPARSASEQALISTAADRALDEWNPVARPGETVRKVFLDTTNLDAYDQAYVIARLRKKILDEGLALTAERQEADLVLTVASGALSINRHDYLFGIPSLPLPIPYAGDTLKLPEVPIFKLISYIGRAKLLMTAEDPASGAATRKIPLLYGRSKLLYWWLLLFGPFESTDLPEY